MASIYLNGVGAALAASNKAAKAFLGSTTSGSALIGSDGADAFRGYSYATSFAGGKGDDTYYVSRSTDAVIERASEGIDTVMAEQKYKLGANIENLTLTGTNAWYGEGNALANILTANMDNQTLNGGAGNDVLVGVGKNETFIVAKGNGSDAIYGWNATDQIRLDGYGLTSFAGVKSIASQAGSDTVLKFANGEQLVIRDTQVSSLTADNFLLQHDKSGLVQTFGDEFNSLSLLSKGGTWRTEYGWGGAGTLTSRTLAGESEIYMDAAYAGTGKKALGIDPFAINNGILTITAAPTPDAAKQYLGGADYTSGLLTSKFTFAQEYGYFEIRAQLPTGQGMWPAFWLLPTDGSWPPELDVFEGLGRDPNTIFLTSHGVDAAGKHTYDQAMVDLDTTQWHTYAVDWGPNTITYIIDGIAVATQPTPDALKGKEMYMLINLAVGGGGWAGDYNAATGTRQMNVDYVHAYATDNTVSSTINGAQTVYSHDVAPVTSSPLAVLAGTSTADKLVATAANSDLWSYAGDDVLRAGTFAASMHGGQGNDTYYVAAAGQTVAESAGEGTDTVRSTVNYVLTDNVENLVLDGTASINGTGNALANRMIGNGGNNVLTAGAGNDYLDGGTAGVDVLIGGAGDDVYYVNHAGTTLTEKAGEGSDAVHSTISWTLGDNFETLALDGSANINGTGNNLGDRLIGNTGNNVLAGGTGNDQLDGGTAGADTLIGSKGDDTYYVNHAGTTLIEKAGEGADSVHAAISWILGDNFETLALDGTGNINGTGNALANRLVGNSGSNVLNGGAGSDTLTGGGGKDTFTFDAGFGKDKVTDFNVNDDYLQFHGQSKAQMHLTQVGANVVIDFGGADTVTLLGVQATDTHLLSHLLF